MPEMIALTPAGIKVTLQAIVELQEKSKRIEAAVKQLQNLAERQQGDGR